MRGFHTVPSIPRHSCLETAFDEAWLTLKAVGNTTVRPDELARSVLRLAMEGERDPVRLHDGALEGLLPATAWREAGSGLSRARRGRSFGIRSSGLRNQHRDAGEQAAAAKVPMNAACTNGTDLRKALRIDCSRLADC